MAKTEVAKRKYTSSKKYADFRQLLDPENHAWHGTAGQEPGERSFPSEPAIFYLGTHENPRTPKRSAGPCHEVSTSENFTSARLMASDDPKLSIPGVLGMVRSRFSAGANGTQLWPS